MKKPKKSVPLSMRPKSYVLTVEYKGGWPAFVSFDYHYYDLGEVMKHVAWLGKQLEGQNGKKAERRNVVTVFRLEERLRSKKLDKELPVIEKFVQPKGREKPKGGKLSMQVNID